MSDIYLVVLRRLATRPRLIGLGALAAITLLLAWLVGRSEGSDKVDVVDLINGLGLTLAIPVVCLVFASAALGDFYDNSSLVYLWLRPLPRWQIVLAALAAVITICAPPMVVMLGLAGVVAGGGTSVALGSFVAALFAVPAYSAIFVALGVFSTRALIWGLGYILVFEGFVGIAGPAASRIALVSYSRSILAKASDVPINLATTNLAVAVIVLAAVVALGMAVGSWRLSHMDIP